MPKKQPIQFVSSIDAFTKAVQAQPKKPVCLQLRKTLHDRPELKEALRHNNLNEQSYIAAWDENANDILHPENPNSSTTLILNELSLRTRWLSDAPTRLIIHANMQPHNQKKLFGPCNADRIITAFDLTPPLPYKKMSYKKTTDDPSLTEDNSVRAGDILYLPAGTKLKTLAMPQSCVVMEVSSILPHQNG